MSKGKKSDARRRAMFANMNKYSHPPRTQITSPDTHTNRDAWLKEDKVERIDFKGLNTPPKPKSKYDLSAKNRDTNNIEMRNLNPLNKKSGLKDLGINNTKQVRKTEKPNTKSSNIQVIPSQKPLKYAVRQVIPMIISPIIGVPIPNSVSNAAFDSIVDSYEVYQEKKNIDDALYVGVESFVNNYARNSVNDYLQSHVQKRTDDTIFKDVLLGIILLSSSMPSMIDF